MQGRADWKRGRFNVNAETTFIHRALRSWQARTGDTLTYYRFQRSESEMHDVYDEATGAGRVYYGRWQVPALHVTHMEASSTEPRDEGMYVTDTLHAVLEFDQLSKFGLTNMDIRHGSFQRDRVAYDGALYGVEQVSILGQIRRRDVIVTIDATQIHNDELVNDPAFIAYQQDPSANPLPPEVVAKTILPLPKPPDGSDVYS